MKQPFAALALLALTLGSPVTAQAFEPDETTTINVYDRASKAVVSIRSRGGTGTGAIIDPRGLIVTNNHVVQGSEQVQVRTADGRTYTGTVRSVDARNDLATVEIRADRPLPSLSISRGSARVGQRVYAIGNPFGLDRTLTVGILSRIAADGDLQTDAALNPGNSGGPLLNSEGELIGVNKAILGSRYGNSGIGFATAVAPLRQLLASSTAAPARVAAAPSQRARRGLGVILDAATLTVLEVQPGSPAARSGLLPGDQLLGINDFNLQNSAQLQQILQRNPSTLLLTVVRDQQVGRVRVEL